LAQYRAIRTYVKGTVMEYGSHELAPSVNGLVVRLAETDKMLFNQIVDMNDKTIDDTLFEFFVTADNPGKCDFINLFVQFTDVSNPDNYFKVRFGRYGGNADSAHVMYPATYMLAGGNGQPMSGWEGGAWNKLHVENEWGAQVRHSFDSTYDNGKTTNGVGSTRVALSYDAVSKSVYVNNMFVIDFDNPRYFTTLWDGFETGKVKMSVWAESYSTTSANFVVTKVAEELSLTATTMEEKTPPVLTVDTEYDKNAMPQAQVGMKYPVATATAFDEYSGVCPVTTEVYYNYTNAANAVKVDIVDGKFDVKNVGDYAIVYTAKDYMGNVAQEIYWIDAVTQVSKAEIVLESALPAEMNAGELIQLPAYSVTGGSGNSVVEIYAIYGDEEVLLTNSFRPNAVGKHTIKYVATDYIGGESVKEIVIDVKGGTAPIFVDEPEFPKYLIAGASYALPELYANDYTSGELVRRLATITVEDANGTKAIENGATYVPAVANNFDTVKITYTVDSTTYVVERQAVLSKDANGGVIVTNYFALDGVTITPHNENSTIAATSANGPASFRAGRESRRMPVPRGGLLYGSAG